MPEDVKPVKQPVKDEAPVSEVKADKPAEAAAGTAAKKKSSTLKIVLIVVGVLVGLAILGTIATILFFGALFNSVDDNISTDDGNVTIKSDDGTVTTSAGEDAQLSEGFPSDVPIYEPSTIVGSTKINNTQFSAVAKTSKSVADVTNYYKSEMAAKGWAVGFESISTDVSTLSFTKDNRSASVVVTNSTEEASDEKTGFVVSTGTLE